MDYPSEEDYGYPDESEFDEMDFSFIFQEYQSFHDPSKCRENGGFDNDCCALEGTSSCADGFEMVMNPSQVCYDGGDWKAYSYICLDPMEIFNSMGFEEEDYPYDSDYDYEYYPEEPTGMNYTADQIKYEFGGYHPGPLSDFTKEILVDSIIYGINQNYNKTFLQFEDDAWFLTLYIDIQSMSTDTFGLWVHVKNQTCFAKSQDLMTFNVSDPLGDCQGLDGTTI